ncbi:protein geranylgeranyltransferase-like protein type I beta subunit [Spinellus fusiger]|nr:protein geranylgeranyltransferase-like protein type I beta subunit [Spinellus fusiger]
MAVEDVKSLAPEFIREKHIRYFKSNLTMLPSAYTETETNRMTLAFFCLNSLQLMGVLDEQISKQNQQDWIEWIYAQQILTATNGDQDSNMEHCGFRGSSWSGRPYDPQATHACYEHYDSSHIANTYTALLNLIILGDDLSRVHRKAILSTIRSLQQEDGGIAPTKGSNEQDVRFVYCAAAICYILDDWSGLDMEKTVDYIRRLQSYEYAIGQSPGQESHGGSTFCGTGALTLMEKQEEGLLCREKLIKWCLMRQSTGFEGRVNKNADTCYCFWIGGALKMLDAYELVNHENCYDFLMSSQFVVGGFGKDVGAYPDVLHSYMGIATLSLLNTPGIEPVHTALNLSLSSWEKFKAKSLA